MRVGITVAPIESDQINRLVPRWTQLFIRYHAEHCVQRAHLLLDRAERKLMSLSMLADGDDHNPPTLAELRDLLAGEPSEQEFRLVVQETLGQGQYARVTTAPMRGPEEIEADLTWERALPEYRHVKGFRGGYLLLALHSREGMVITLWESEADARAESESGQRTAVLSRFSEIMDGPPEVQGYEVAASV